MNPEQAALPVGLLLLLVGLVLCFAGVRSLRLTGACAGFALAWMIADLLGASVLVGLVIAVAGAIGGLVLISLVFRFAMWVLGGLAGATIAIKIYAHVGMGQGSALVAVLLAAAVGLIVGFLADRHRDPLLAAVTAFSGASVILNALAALAPATLAFLGEPKTGIQSVIASGVWLVVALAGWLVQRRALQSRAERVS
jgi:uncharacterized membrane protein